MPLRTYLFGETRRRLLQNRLKHPNNLIKYRLSNPRSVSKQAIVHLRKRYILEAKYPFRVMVCDHNTVHVADTGLEP